MFFVKIYDVFISYRRSDGLPFAEALYDYLTSKGLRVFFDKNEMIDGHYFTTQIEKNLIIAPNYILIATDDVFKFRNGEDWVKREIEVAIKEYESDPADRTLTVLVPESACFPEKEALPESVRNIADAQRIPLPYGEDFTKAFYKALKSVTNINRRNLWFAAHRWLENSKQPGGRFANLSINESILPESSSQKEDQQQYMPINVYRKNIENEIKLPLFEAVSQTQNSFYLIGQGGIGKTTALMHIMNNAYEGEQYSENAQIPIFVELSFAPDTFGALYEGGKSSFIRRSIFKQVRADRTIKQVTSKEVRDIDEVFASIPYDVAVKPITDILSKTTPAPEYLLLLDGLNEVSSVTIEETGSSVIQMIMREIDLLLTECPNVRIVLTSRSDESSVSSDSISRLYLSGVEEESIKKYLESCNFPKEAIDKISEDESLFETLQIPLFLTMYASLSKCNEASTQGEILKLFFNERRKNISVYTMQQRLAEVEKNVTDAASASQKKRIDADMQNFILDFILPEIAWQMERNGEFYIYSEDIEDTIEEIITSKSKISVCGKYGKALFNKYNNNSTDIKNTYITAKKIIEKMGEDISVISERILKCCVFAFGIMQNHYGKYGFVHQHIRDYFAAVKNINTIRLSVYLYEENEKELALECMNKTFKDEPVNYTVRRFMGEYLGEHRNKPYYENEKWNYGVPAGKCDRSLLKRVLDVYRGCFDGECGYGVYSVIQILKEIRDDLRGENFSHIDLLYCNFNGHKLGESMLYADFSNAVVSGDSLFSSGHNDIIMSASFSTDGQKLVTASKDNTVKIWDIKTGKCIHTLKKHTASVNYAEFSADDKFIVSASDDGTAMLWDAKNGKHIATMKRHTRPVISVAFSHNGDYIVTASPFEMIILWNGKTGEMIQIIGESSRVNDISFSYDDQNIIMSSEGNMKMSEIRYWNVKSKAFITPFPESNDVARVVSCCPDGKHLIAAMQNGTVKIFNMHSHLLCKESHLHSHLIISICFNNNGELFASNSLDKSMLICKTSSIEIVAKIYNSNPTHSLLSISNDGKFLAVTSETNVEIWDIATQKCVLKIKGCSSLISCASFSSNGKQLVVATEDNTASVWETQNFRYVFSIKDSSNKIKYIVFNDSENTELISSSDYNTVKVWNSKSLAVNRIEDYQKNTVRNYALNDNSTYLLLTKNKQSISVWEKGKIIASLNIIPGLMVSGIDFSSINTKSNFTTEEKYLLQQYGADI